MEINTKDARTILQTLMPLRSDLRVMKYLDTDNSFFPVARSLLKPWDSAELVADAPQWHIPCADTAHQILDMCETTMPQR